MNMRLLRSRLVAPTVPLTAFLLLAAATADAEPRLRPLWEAGAGVAVLSIPDYRGSDQQRSYVFPIPYLVYRGEVVQVDREKVRGLLFKTDRFDLDLSANGSVPVRSGSNEARAGMPNLRPTVELGPQLNFRFADNERYRLSLHLPLRNVREVTGGLPNTGWLFNPNLNLDIKDTGPDGGWNLGISGGPTWADRRYHNYFYGVGAAFATPTRPAFEARGGYSGSHLTLALSKRYPKFWAGAFVRVTDLHGVAFEDSPLLRRKTSHMAGFGVSWVFGQSERMVMADD